MRKHTREKTQTGNIQQGLTKVKQCLTQWMVFYDKMAGLVGEGRAVDVVGLGVREQGCNRHCEEGQQELGWRRAA